MLPGMTNVVGRLNAALEGRYRVERELGEGGMALVYLASDLRHHRKVALKVLKPELAAVVGADRFLGEIETTANLQHPHILPLFDSGQADGFLFYVMPYVEGETLRDRLDRERQLPVDEALGIATAVAHALQCAHDHGVIHRDIKPGNILLSRGEPLIADFGIALAVGAAGGGRLTETGLSVGTPYYMSPEQATGDQVVGPATDTYALGCVLYEMLVGEPPYLGSTAQAVLGKIIQGLPVSATATRRTVPHNVDAAIRRTLEKLPADRFARVDDFAKALADPGFRHGRDDAVVAASGPWKRLALASSTVAALALLGAAWSMIAPSAASTPVTRHRILPLAPDLARSLGAYTALAPDGSSMVFGVPEGDGWRLWLKARGEAEPTLLTGTDGAQNVEYSPGGDAIVFATGTELKRRPIGDGSTVTLAEGLPATGPASMTAVAWQDDGSILHEGPRAALVRIPEAGGAADTLVAFQDRGYTNLAWVGALPGSRGALVAICRGVCGEGISLGVVDFAADTTRILVDQVVRGWYTPLGQLMYLRTDGAVFAAPFDLDALELTGPGIPLFEGVAVNVSTPEMAVGRDGTVLYAEGGQATVTRRLVWVDRTGRAEPVDASLGPAIYAAAALAPDDRRVALALITDGPPQIWVKELPDGPMTRLTTGSVAAIRPVWSPDGRTVGFVAQAVGDSSRARTVAADGSSQGASEPLLEGPLLVFEIVFTRDGNGVLYRHGNAGTGDGDLGFRDLQAGTTEEQLLASSFNEAGPSLSPDGRWMAYTSNSSGRSEVFVRPFPMGSQQVQVSTNGGTGPVWAHNGREIFFVDGESWVASATYVAGETFQVERRERLFDARTYLRDTAWRSFDVSSDDTRFLMIAVQQANAERGAEGLVLIQGYFQELAARLGR
jgi:serine/threonine-protein kinase